MITVVCWNIAGRKQPWEELLEMDADVALLQEAGLPPSKRIADRVDIGSIDHWRDANYDVFPMVVQLSDRVKVDRYTPVSPARVGTGKVKNVNESELAVSDVTTIAAARIRPANGEPFVVASMYARWLNFHPHAHEGPGSWTIHGDASAHRIVSDLSALVRDPTKSQFRILAAGDLNAIYGAVPTSKLAAVPREDMIFDRMEALGFEFLGPQAPNGRQADPPSRDVPSATKNVATYHTTRQKPTTAANQLDYVFASRGFHESVRTRALNEVDEWGSSDHCRILIEVGE